MHNREELSDKSNLQKKEKVWSRKLRYLANELVFAVLRQGVPLWASSPKRRFTGAASFNI